MKKLPVFSALALSAVLQLTMVGFTQAQTPSTPSPSASPVKSTAEATPAATASVSPSASPAASPVAEAVPVRKKILEQYDINHNGKLDADEKASFDRDRMLRKADRLKKYDKNGDGRLDDAERAAMRADLDAKASPKP